MPNLNIDQFDSPPSEGDKIKVIGVIKSIDHQTGDVEASYDKVTVIGKGKPSDNTDNTDNTDNNSSDNSNQDQNSYQTSDEALNQAFNKTQ